jgi:hypothetical protein
MAESLIDTITLDDLIHDEAEASFPLIPSGACHTYHMHVLAMAHSSISGIC